MQYGIYITALYYLECMDRGKATLTPCAIKHIAIKRLDNIMSAKLKFKHLDSFSVSSFFFIMMYSGMCNVLPRKQFSTVVKYTSCQIVSDDFIKAGDVYVKRRTTAHISFVLEFTLSDLWICFDLQRASSQYARDTWNKTVAWKFKLK